MKRLAKYLLSGLPVVMLNAAQTVNELADNIIYQLGAGNKMIVVLAYVSGLGFMMVSFFKFKQHKDNPAQNPVGNPLTMMLIGVLLMYIGNLSMPLGETLFGTEGGPASGADLILSD